MNDRDVDDDAGGAADDAADDGPFIQTRLMFPVFVWMRTETEIEYECRKKERRGDSIK